jgi:hypothetical protein
MLAPMLRIEVACVLIVAVYFVANRNNRGDLGNAAYIAVASLLGENTMIHVYDYYAYVPEWHARVGHVPWLVAAIWAPVVLSARSIARTLLRSPGVMREALLTGALVTFDAFLIEPIAVRAGLWHWNAPGLFAVPLIGIVGWGLFAAAVVVCLARLRGWARLAVIPLSIVATHMGLVALWWIAFRWTLRSPLDWRAASVALACVSVLFTGAAWRAPAVLSWRELGPRAIATGFFAVLLASRFDVSLGVWALLFTPPWFALCARALSATPRATLQTVH